MILNIILVLNGLYIFYILLDVPIINSDRFSMVVGLDSFASTLRR